MLKVGRGSERLNCGVGKFFSEQPAETSAKLLAGNAPIGARAGGAKKLKLSRSGFAKALHLEDDAFARVLLDPDNSARERALARLEVNEQLLALIAEVAVQRGSPASHSPPPRPSADSEAVNSATAQASSLKSSRGTIQET